MHLGAKLKYIMELMGLNAEELGSKIGVGGSHVRHIIRDPRRKLDYDKILLLHKLTKFPIEYFLDENILKPSDAASTPELAKALEEELYYINLVRDEKLTKEEATELLRTIKLKRRD